MPTVTTTPGEALRETFRAWHAEQESVDAQLRDSLEALSAYQSHLDQWQQRLVHERDELIASRGSLEKERAEAEASRVLLNERDAETLARQQELDCRDHELHSRQAELDRETRELASSRSEGERFREETLAATEQVKQERAELRVASEKLEQEREELKTAQLQLNHGRNELEASRRQLERDRDALRTKDSATEDALKAELHAAREKVGSLTDNVLSRTEELRTLDIRRAEAVAELELVRAREAELKAALEEHKRTAELDRLNWTAEVRQLHDLLQRRPEPAFAETRESARAQEAAVVLAAASTATATPATNNKPVPTAVASRGNPVLGSIVQQFDKLRQQRATDRQSGQKPR